MNFIHIGKVYGSVKTRCGLKAEYSARKNETKIVLIISAGVTNTSTTT